MALLNIEKTSNNQNNVGNMDSMNNMNNISYNPVDENDYIGVKGDTIKKETTLYSSILSTIIEAVIVLWIIGLLVFIGLNISKFKIELFTLLDSYTLEEYNAAIRRSFVMLSGSLIIMCFVIKFVINTSIRGRFRRLYLNKFNIYAYDVFVWVFNIVVYLGVGFFFFYLINEIHDTILLQNFVDEVNKETINLLKYAVVIIITIFGMLNSFSGVSIVHKNNKFVLDDIDV